MQTLSDVIFFTNQTVLETKTNKLAARLKKFY